MKVLKNENTGEEMNTHAASSGASTVVEMSGIEKSFPGVHALRSARFDLHAGEVHALMGENGAGKSTLMKILTGVYQPDGGEIRVARDAVTVQGPRDAQDLGISIIHQELYLMNHLTAAQNIFIGREPRRGLGIFVDEAKMNEDARALFRRMKVDIDPAGEVGSLTVARQQLVEIAKALSFNSRVLIMDEPTSALNETEGDHLFAIIADLKAHGVGIVYITHKMDDVLAGESMSEIARRWNAAVEGHLADGRARACRRHARRRHPRRRRGAARDRPEPRPRHP